MTAASVVVVVVVVLTALLPIPAAFGKHKTDNRRANEEEKKEIGDGEESKEIGRLCKCIFEIDCLIEVATVDFFSQVGLSRDSLLLLIFASLSWTVVTKRN